MREVTPWEVSISVASFFFFFFFFGGGKGERGRETENPGLVLLSSQAETGRRFQSRGDGTLGVCMQASGIPMSSMSRDLFIS